MNIATLETQQKAAMQMRRYRVSVYEFIKSWFDFEGSPEEVRQSYLNDEIFRHNVNAVLRSCLFVGRTTIYGWGSDLSLMPKRYEHSLGIALAFYRLNLKEPA